MQNNPTRSKFLNPRNLASMTMAFILLTMGVGVYSIWQVSQIHQSLEATQSFFVPVLKQLGYINGKWSAYQKSYEHSMGFKKWGKTNEVFPDMKINLKNLIDPNLKNLEQRVILSDGQVEAEILGKLQDFLHLIRTTTGDERDRVLEVTDFLKNKNFEKAGYGYSKTKAIHQNFSHEIQRLTRDYEAKLSEIQFSMDGKFSFSHGLMFFVLISCLFTQFLVLYKMRRWIMPVFELTQVSQQIAIHGLSKEVHFPTIKQGMLNEVADLIREFSRMAITLMEREKTIQMQAELKKEQNTLLKKLGALNEKIIQGMDSGLILLNHNHQIEKVNSVFCQVFGRKEAECIGKSISEVLELEIHLAPGFFQKVELIENRFFDIRISSASGSKTTQEILILITEVTKLKEAEEKLAHLRKIGLAGNLSVQVAHEIRNPLHSMSLHIEMLKEDLESLNHDQNRKDLEERAEKILDQVSRLDRITLKYLNMKTKSEKAEIAHEQYVSISKVIYQCIEFSREELNSQKIVVQANLDQTYCDKVKGDADQLSQVFYNLIRNSIESLSNIDFTPENPNRNLLITVKKSDKFIVVRIEDSGSGISESIQDKIFEPFVTSKPSGSGMGLCLSRHICIEHGGDLKVLKNRNLKFSSGASFEMQLPV